MKKISDFKNNKIHTSLVNNFCGGKKVTSSATTLMENGCTRYQYDEFEDTNGDGLWGDNESGFYCDEITCVDV